jgi:hypothetical protein
VATASLVDIQATSLPASVLLFASSVVALACVEWPASIDEAARETVTLATGTAVTVIVAFPAFPSLVAVMFAVPTL